VLVVTTAPPSVSTNREYPPGAPSSRSLLPVAGSQAVTGSSVAEDAV